MMKVTWQIALESDEEKIVMEIRCRMGGALVNGNVLAERLQPAPLVNAMRAAIEKRMEELEREAMKRKGSLN